VFKWYDAAEPRRDERHARVPEPRIKHRARKDRRHWCKGKVGVPHRPVIRLGKYAAFRVRYVDRNPCYAATWLRRSNYWICSHERACEVCGKILEATLGESCPDRPTNT
jgi:hypothetical protein